MLHHYGSSLNSLPLLDNFLHSNPPPTSKADSATPATPAAHASFHDLRIGYGGHMGVLTNIHRDGFGSMGFHAWPETLAWDGYSGDFGAGYLGHVVGSVCVLVLHERLGWLGFGGDVVEEEEIQEGEEGGGGGGGIVGGVKVKVQPKDTVRRKIYVASMGAKVEISAGVIREFVYYHHYHHHHHNATKEHKKETKETKKKEKKNKLIIELNRVASENASQAILKVEDTTGMGIKLKTRGLRNVRGGGYLVDLPGWVEIGL